MSHGQVKRHEEVGASADVLDEGLSLSTKGTKGRDYKGDNPQSCEHQEGAYIGIRNL